ncbi:MAG: RsmD family RNA methyltransferase [Halobacteriovoraceae bacterium]|nr:RsmD family RNA methyltransferase [Halobacteriovoraceae bacterium]
MSIKIMGGLAKSRSLFIPKGTQTRPTSVLLKRRIFDSHQDLSSFHFIDLCAGSGSVGLEAWSRGALSVTFVENHRNATHAIKNNIKAFKEAFPEEFNERSISLHNTSVLSWIKSADWSEDTILFLDPPYEDLKLVETLSQAIMDKGDFGLFWLESDRTKGFPAEHWEKKGWIPKKVYQQGTSYIASFC